MPVSPSFVVCPYGQWTALCQLKPERVSLLIGAVDGVFILATNTTGQLQTTSYGTVPAGFYYSPTSGTGWSVFELVGEIGTQEWFVWPLPGSGGPSSFDQFVQKSGNNDTWHAGATSVTYTNGLDLETAIVVVADVQVVGNPPATLTSALSGALTAIATATTANVGGNVADVQIFLYVPSAINDTLTAAGANGLLSMGVYSLGTNLTGDQSATNTGNGTPLTAVTGPVATINEVAYAAFVAAFSGVPSGSWAAPWSSYDGGLNVTDDNGQWWASGVGQQGPPISGAITAELDGATTYGQWGMAVATVAASGPTATTMAVLESFDLPVQTETGTITAGLPRLSRAGVDALNDLLGRVVTVASAEAEATEQIDL
jgi:hypothetical protein